MSHVHVTCMVWATHITHLALHLELKVFGEMSRLEGGFGVSVALAGS